MQRKIQKSEREKCTMLWIKYEIFIQIFVKVMKHRFNTARYKIQCMKQIVNAENTIQWTK